MNRFGFQLAAISAIAAAVFAFMLPGDAAEPSPVDFRIVVSVDAGQDSVELKCVKGCEWSQLSFQCRPDEACSSVIDRYGMTGE